MDLFTYLMAKKGHNIGGDLFSYLLGKKPGGGGRLPDAYQEVEYIQSTGTQYIDTGVPPDVTIEFEIDYAITQIAQFESLTGSDPEQNKWFSFGIVGNSSVKRNYIYVGNSNKTFTNNYGELNLKTKAVYSNGSITISNINGSVTQTLTNITMGVNNLPMFLFALNRQNKASDNSYVKIYSAILNKNNEKVRELVPCYRKSDNVIGLYDLVNKTFYTNAGTGTFLKGNDIN